MITLKDCNLIEYGQGWELQNQLFANAQQTDTETLMLCQHPHVYTLGKSGHIENLLINSDILQKINATYYKTDRGGDITYHGPGQLVAYPIINLKNHNLSLREYIYNLEQAVILTLAEYNITAARSQGATGVWIEDKRKICAIGVRASRNITMHGLALNITTDLDYFRHINPCGFVDRGVTSVKQEFLLANQEPNIIDEQLFADVQSKFIIHFNALFNN